MKILHLKGIFNIFSLHQCQNIDKAFSPGSATLLGLNLPQDMKSM